MMRNIYQNTSRQYSYPSSTASVAINNAMNGIAGRYAAAAQMSSMAAAAAVGAVGTPYTSMAAQFSSIPNTVASSGLNQFQDQMLHYQTY